MGQQTGTPLSLSMADSGENILFAKLDILQGLIPVDQDCSESSWPTKVAGFAARAESMFSSHCFPVAMEA